MNYQQTLDFLYASLPMFQRIGDAAIKKDLGNIRKLCDLLDHPERTFASIHIAGTNGKGSTSHMLAAIFQKAGFKTGLYTSPHYVDFRERIRVNGEMISKRKVVRFVSKYQRNWSSIHPSFFEITVAMAFDHFREEQVDIAIIETGLGGRLDSTNILLPDMSVITNIAFDHMQMLGDTLEKIAFEKAGIIKAGIPVVIGDWHKSTAPVFKLKAKTARAPIHFSSHHVRVVPLEQQLDKQSFRVMAGKEIWLEKLILDLAGAYQERNVRTVLEAIWRWNLYYPNRKIADRYVLAGLRQVRSISGMIGRWMILRRRPLVIIDAAHNEHGMESILPSLFGIRARTRHFVLGFVNDKEISKILRMFPSEGEYYWCSPDIPRGKPAIETMEIAASIGMKGRAFQNVKSAYNAALKTAGPGDLIFIGGSSYVVGDVLK